MTTVVETIIAPEALNELLLRDPFALSDTDLDNIIRFFRVEREKWVADETAGKHKRETSTAPKAKAILTAPVKLSDLELDL